MVQLSPEDAQTLIYRGCARLAQAMQVKRIAKADAEEWESLAVLEAKMILKVALRGPITVLRIPPLPLAVLEVQKQLEIDGRRPMRPSDIHSPYEQASSSAYKALMTREGESEIPFGVDLGDPTSFWWEHLEEASESSIEESEDPLWHYSEPGLDGMLNAEPMLTTVPNGEPAPVEGTPPPLARSCMRTRAGTPSDDEGDDSCVYIPRCKNCKRRNEVCRTPKAGAVCTPCKLRRRRCSARRKGSAIKQTDTSDMPVVPMGAKPQGESKSVNEMLPSQVKASGSGSQVDKAPITTEEEVMESEASRPPSKRKRVYVAVPPFPYRLRMPPTPAAQSPPGGKRMSRKLMEPDTIVGSTSADSGSEVSAGWNSTAKSTPEVGIPPVALPVAMRTQTFPAVDVSPFDQLSNRQRRLLVALAPFLEAVLAEHA